MYVFKNALKNITRAKGRTVLIFILVLVIAISACVALSIKSSAEKATQTAFENMSVTGQIEIDRTSMMNNNKRDPDAMKDMMQLMAQSLSKEELDLFATSSNVKDYYYSSTFSLNTTEDGIETYSLENEMPSMPNKGGQTGGSMLNKSTGDFTVTGYASHSAMVDFINGTLSILEGAMFEENDALNSAVISMELALLNEIEVGDTITLVNPMKEDEFIEMTVSGIFTCETTDSYSNDIYISYSSLENICLNSESVAEMYTDERTGEEVSTAITSRIQGTYVFKSPENLEAFKIDLADMGLDTSVYTVVSSDITEFDKSILPLENLGDFTVVFFIVVLVIGAIILIVFNLFTIRERKYEIGVLAAIGMRKSKVAIQFLCEVLVVTFIAVFIGTGIGAVASKPIGDALLENQIQSIETENDNANNNFGGNFSGRPSMGKAPMGMQENASADVEYIDTIATSTDFVVLIQLMGLGLLLSLVASSIGIVSILRYEPLQILSERS